MGNFSKPPLQVLTTNLDRGYVGLHIEQGVPVLDRDLNLLNDLISATVRAIVSRYIGDGVAAGSEGFAIAAIPADNDFRILAGTGGPGTCLVGGIEVTIKNDINYSAQIVPPDVPPLDPLPLTTPDDTQPDPRIDTVYLDVWLAEVTGADDEDLLNEDDVGMQTSVRLKPAWLVRVAEGVPVPVPDPGHTHYPLARLERERDIAEIKEGMITDLRQTILTLADVERRLSFLEEITLVPSFAPSPNQFDPKFGAPGTPVTLFGNNFNVGALQVQFGTVTLDAAKVGTPTATQVDVNVPDDITGPVIIKVITAGGEVESDDTFTVLPPPPSFRPSPNQFDPKFGAPGTPVKLFGENFDVGTVTVRFGTTEAVLVGTPTSTEVRADVPTMASGPVKITVQTGGGSVTSDDDFTVI